MDNFSSDLFQVNWKEDLLFRVVTLEIQQTSADFVSEISRPNVVKTDLFVSSLNYQSSTIILSIGNKYYEYDLYFVMSLTMPDLQSEDIHHIR